ncbi:MAG: hypothetical protein BWY37_00377 [Firmicutes bacterium ADurb.Bin262]|nr:MAG: hypothetical protein BWY37_00377 [Firmicutes bacterium ADurb.Bin262]
MNGIIGTVICRERPPCRSEASIERHVSLIVPQANFTPAGCFTSAFLCFLRSPNHGFGSMRSTIFRNDTSTKSRIWFGSFPTKYAFPNRVFRRAIHSNYLNRFSIYHVGNGPRAVPGMRSAVFRKSCRRRTSRPQGSSLPLFCVFCVRQITDLEVCVPPYFPERHRGRSLRNTLSRIACFVVQLFQIIFIDFQYIIYHVGNGPRAVPGMRSAVFRKSCRRRIFLTAAFIV